MAFVNPLDILGFSPQGPAPDQGALRKARRAKLLEFDLDDGLIRHDGVTVTRSDFLRACEDLDDERYLAACRALQRLPRLQAFLSSGDPSVFEEPLPPFVYHPRFLDVVGPHFAERYASALADAVRGGDRDTVRRLAGRRPVAPEHLYSKLYGTTEGILRDQASALRELTMRLENHDAIDSSHARQAASVVDVDTVELLPDYFEGSRSKLGQALRLLAVACFNERDDAEAANAILRSASKLTVNPVTADRIRRDLAQIDRIHKRRRLSEKHAPDLKNAADLLVCLRGLIDAAGNNGFDTSGAAAAIDQDIDAARLRSLPDAVAEVCAHIVVALRSLALTCWNEHQDADAARRILQRALAVARDEQIRERLEEEVSTLGKMGREMTAQAQREGTMLLALLRKMAADTDTGLFGPSVNWTAVEEALKDLFDDDGIRLLRAIRDKNLIEGIRTSLYELLCRLAKLRPRGAAALRSRVGPILSLSASEQISRKMSSSAPGDMRSVSISRPPRPRVAGGASGASSSRFVADKEVSARPIAFALAGLVLFIIYLLALEEEGNARSTPPPPKLGETMEVAVVAASGKLSPIRVKVDEDLRRPYWVELGDTVTFLVTDSVYVYEELEDVVILVDGESYPTDYRDASERVVITRESVRALLNERELPGLAQDNQQPEPGQTPTPPPVSRWKGNHLATGSSPYDLHFGPSRYSSTDANEITFLNGHGSDVIVCLVDVRSGRTARNEYIRAGDTFTMTEVPDGTYFIRGFYGRDWNPDREIGGRQLGLFETDVSFSESRHDPLRLVDTGFSATAYEVTLYAVSNGNMNSSDISASTFFN